MSNPKHTPGPWVKMPDVFPDGCIDIRSGTKEVAFCRFPESKTSEEINANARLIAAAPELLEALEVALETLLEQPDLVGDADISIQTIKQAIAKATGDAE